MATIQQLSCGPRWGKQFKKQQQQAYKRLLPQLLLPRKSYFLPHAPQTLHLLAAKQQEEQQQQAVYINNIVATARKLLVALTYAEGGWVVATNENCLRCQRVAFAFGKKSTKSGRQQKKKTLTY